MKFMKLVVILTLLAFYSAFALQLVGSPAAHAATSYSWTGQGNDGQWSDSRNWSPNGVPGAGDAAAISVAEIITVPDGTTVQSLTVSGQGTLLSNGA